MRVLLIHQAFVSPKEAGGTRHFELAKHCYNNGIDFSIVASDLCYLSGRKTIKGRGIVKKESDEKISVYRAYTYPALHTSFIWRVFSFFSFMLTSIIAAFRAGPVDLVMGTSPPIFQAVSAWAAAKIKRVPFLLEVRDLWPAFAIDMGILKNPILIWLSKRLESFLYAQADHILVNSPAYRDYMIQRGISSKNVTLIPNGVEVEMFNANGNGVRNELDLNGKFVVTYAGALGQANDIPTLLRAADNLKCNKNIHFLIVGDGKERLNLEELARQRKISNVTFTGARPKSDMPGFLSASDACVAILQNIPMFQTTYPNKVFDYMAACKPTLLAIDGVIREVVEAANGGIFIPPGNAKALSNAISELAEHPHLAVKMGQAAHRYVRVHFDRRKQAYKFIDLLRGVAS